MGKVRKFFHAALINDSPDEHCNHFQIELSHDGYHIHYRNLRIVLSQSEMKEWKTAFEISRPKIKHQNLL